jgi:aspartate racemase
MRFSQPFRSTMKTIGMIGGMSWESSLLYYRLLNQGVNQRLGGLHSAKIVLNSIDFAPLEQLQHQGDWQAAAAILIQAAQQIEAANADFFMIATNTMHQVADAVTAAVGIPLLHIADATAEALKADQVKRIGLLGTAFTMELDFYRDRIQQHGIDVVVPELHDRQMVHDIIYQELCRGRVDDDSRDVYLAIIERMRAQHIDGVILGCTEIGMLLQPEHTDLRLYDTTALHAAHAVELALQD